MPFLGSKYAKMLLRLGLCPGPRWGSLQRSSRPPSWIKGGLLLRGGGGEGKRKGREGERRGKGRGGERMGGEGKGDVAPPFLKFLDPPLKLFSKWPPSAIFSMRKLPFWSCDLYLHAIFHV